MNAYCVPVVMWIPVDKIQCYPYGYICIWWIIQSIFLLKFPRPNSVNMCDESNRKKNPSTSNVVKCILNLIIVVNRKSSEEAQKERRRISNLLNIMEPSLLQFYISRQWLNKFKTFAEPGPISNNDFLCIHGGKKSCNAKQW